MRGKATDLAAARNRDALMNLTVGYMASRAVHVAAYLGIADLLEDGPRTGRDLAAETGSHHASLIQLLRALVSVGVLAEPEAELFALTELGEPLRSGSEHSIRNLAMFFGSAPVWRSWEELPQTVRTGDAAFDRIYGTSAFAHFAEHPEMGLLFNAAMAEGAANTARGLCLAHDFSAYDVIIDVGGGNGTLMAALLQQAADARGVLFDTAAGLAGARETLEATGTADRCEITPGDFFASVPPGGDAYVLKSVIHDWDDEDVGRILGNCRAAMRGGSTLLLVERVMPDSVQARPAGDVLSVRAFLHMLVLHGGRERTAAEFERLLDVSGFQLVRMTPLQGTEDHLIVARPASEG